MFEKMNTELGKKIHFKLSYFNGFALYNPTTEEIKQAKKKKKSLHTCYTQWLLNNKYQENQ